MISPSKTFKRLGIVGAAAVVGLVPIGVLSTSAYAVSSATLNLANMAAGAGTTATNSFTVTNAYTGTTPEELTVTAFGGETLPSTQGDYTVTVGGTADPLTTGTATAGGLNASATLALTNAVTAGQQVTVTIVGVLNPGANSSVYFSDQSTSDSNTVDTNGVTITGAAAAVATVTSVNPQAFGTPGGEPFTIMGTGFGTTTATAPTVCFVPVATTTLGATCASTPGGFSVTPTAGNTATELQGTSPALTAKTQYNVIVFNAGAAGSATSAADVVATPQFGGLNFVPESGVRVIDTRIGLGMPVGALTPGAVYTVPEATPGTGVFANTLAVPTNIPSYATAVMFNVTAVAPSGAGNLQLWEAGTCVANNDVRSVVNFQPPQDTNNTNIVVYDRRGNLCIQDNGAPVSVVVDVSGYMTGAYTANVPSDPTTRILDSRPGAPSVQNVVQGPLAGGTVYRVPVPVQSGATAYALNVTAVGPTAGGNLRVFPEPAGGPPAPSGVPNAAAATYIPGVDGGSFLVSMLGDVNTTTNTGYIDLYSDSSGTVNVVIDEIGYFTTGTSVTAISPVRMIDTRPGGIAAGATTSFTAVPFAALPASVPSTALGVIGSLSDIQPTSTGYLVAYPGSTVMPGTASIANYPDQTRSTTAVAAVNPANGMVSVSSVGASTNFTFDATAYIQGVIVVIP